LPLQRLSRQLSRADPQVAEQAGAVYLLGLGIQFHAEEVVSPRSSSAVILSSPLVVIALVVTGAVETRQLWASR
jgi:hypothetical protein